MAKKKEEEQVEEKLLTPLQWYKKEQGLKSRQKEIVTTPGWVLDVMKKYAHYYNDNFLKNFSIRINNLKNK